MNSKIYLGPMSKNIVNTVIEYSNSLKLPFAFIPSRRQVENIGGYVNNWTTKDFVEYVKNIGKYISLERDHAGPGQGTNMDDGLDSLKEDCKYFDIIHIDPWKKYPNYKEGLNETIKALNFCYNENPNLFFEIGTEEGIRKFDIDELERFILDLQKELKPEIYKKIKYLVVQCGTGLLEATNIGYYEKDRLKDMINLCKKYGFMSKEHNGDWISINLMRKKFDLGLDAINIAPELGQIETRAILKAIKNKEEKKTLIEKFYKICLNSKKWVKWVSKDFKPEENKEKLINICGHYVFSYPEFQDIKNQLKDIDKQIKRDLLIKLREYHSLYKSYYKVLIPTTGVGARLGQITKYTNKSLIRVGDKLAICHIIEKYNKYSEFVITLGYKGKFVKDFLELAYPEYFFNFVWIDKYEGKGSSLVYSLLQTKNLLNCPFIFNCCDSLTKDDIMIPKVNTVFVTNNKCGTLYASINTGNNGYIKEIFLKGEINFDFIYTGIAFIKDYSEYWNILEKISEEKNNYELSDVDVINVLLKSKKIKYFEFKSWYDSGNLIEIKHKIKDDYKGNYTILNKNDESICFFKDYVIKFFHNKEIARKRIERGFFLYPLAPKILDYRDNFIKMKFVDGVLLSKITTYGEIKKLLNWAKENLWINNTNSVNFKNICRRFYRDKSHSRINKTLEKVEDFAIINSSNTGSIHDLLKKIDFDSLVTDNFCNFHGDFILDNIIKTKEGYKLLDWRHDFGGELYHGDKYYDLAKLRHNIIFNHDNINNNLFKSQIMDAQIIVDLKCNYTLINQLKDFDNFVRDNNMDLKKIKILMSLIWLNMSPLHDYPINEFLFYFGKYNLFLNLK